MALNGNPIEALKTSLNAYVIAQEAMVSAAQQAGEAAAERQPETSAREVAQSGSAVPAGHSAP